MSHRTKGAVGGQGKAPKNPPPRHGRPDHSNPVTISETCRCGAAVTITAPRGDSETHITGWRATHPCIPPAHLDQKGRTGAGGSSLGFAAPTQRRIT